MPKTKIEGICESIEATRLDIADTTMPALPVENTQARKGAS